MKQTELKRLLEAAIARTERYAERMEPSTNPQVVAVHRQLVVELCTLRAVLDAVNGNAVILRIMGE